MPNRGDIFWLDADAVDAPDVGLRHPHVIISDDVFNHSRVRTLIVCALTSNLNRMHEPGNVLLEPGEGSLPKQSVLVVSQVSSVERTRLGDYIGRLSLERVQQVLDGMRFQQAAFFGRS
jgi:mRNA interferase MazF